MLEYKKNWSEAKVHYEAFWDRSYHERCGLAIPLHLEKTLPPLSQNFTIADRYLNPQCIHERTLHDCAQTAYLYEALPAHYMDFGTARQCEYFGCKPNYTESTVWFSPILDSADASLMNITEAGRKRFEAHKEITAELTRLAGQKYLVAMPDNCGIIDGLAHIRGTDNLLIDMLEEPEFVHDARDKITDVWKKTQKEFFDVIRENNMGGSSHGWMHLWSPARHVQLQCDYSVMISPGMFEEFVLPELEETASAFEHATYHLDGIEQLRHLDMILSVKGIDNIQWTPVAGQPKTSVNIEALQKIQRAGKGLVLVPSVDEVEFLMKNLSHRGLHLIIYGVKNEAEAAEIEKLAVKLAHSEII